MDDAVTAGVRVSRELQEHLELFRRLETLTPVIESAARLMGQSLLQGQKLLFCGNGGSAADSQHLAAEFSGRFVADRRPLAAISLTADSSALTCIANDYSFDEVFARQLLAVGHSGDCLIALSTSGNSRNVVRAVQAAHSSGVHTIGMLGRDGGALGALVELPIVVPSQSTARIQEAHTFIGHMLCSLVEQTLGLA